MTTLATHSNDGPRTEGAPKISPADRAAITLMPLPAELTLEAGQLAIDQGFRVALSGGREPRLERAARRLLERLSAQTGFPLQAGITDEAQGAALTLHCGGSADEVQGVVVDEAYTLVVTEEGARIDAPQPYGVLRGIETFLQLVRPGRDGFVVPAARVADRPRFPWRGLMIDVARHWIPLDAVKRQLDGMAALKLNVFHWHLTDDQGFRVESRRFPRLHELGSDGDYYTQDEIREIVAHARDRGIRVVPEFDLPGHTTAWFVGHPELASAEGPYEIARTFGIKDAAMDPTREEVYAFLEQFFDEMAELFPDPYVHIGGDEVSGVHWDENPQIQAFIEAHDLGDNHGLQAAFTRRLGAILADMGKTMVGWDEILHPDLPRETVVQSWRGQASLAEAAQEGYPTLLSHGYYLDHYQPAAFHYEFDPLPAPAAALDFSGRWESWQVALDSPMGQAEGQLTLVGAGQKLAGRVTLEELNLSAELREIRREGSRLSFEFTSGFGTTTASLVIEGERMEGALRLAGFDVPVSGSLAAGSDRPGSQPPTLPTGPVLTAEARARILGGEACMWAELVNAETIDGRIWPRLAAVAERLWSQAERTQDGADMVRRLEATSDWLTWLGLGHQAQRERMLRRMLPCTMRDHLAPLAALAEVLEPIKGYGRHGTREYSQFTPLNRMVDALPAESERARAFGGLVDGLLADPGSSAVWRAVASWLEIWRDNHARLAPSLRASFLTRPLEPLSERLAEVAALGLEALEALESGVAIPAERRAAHLAALERAAQPHDEVLIAILPALGRLVAAAHKL